MRNDPNERLARAKQQVERWKDLKAALPSAQERLNQENFRLRHVEAGLEQLQQQLQDLESFSLTGLVEGLLGRKQQRLTHCREEMSTLATQRDEVEGALLRADAELRQIEQQLTVMGDPQRELQELCEGKQRDVLTSDCEAAQRLRAMVAEIEVAKGQRRELMRAIQTGRHLLERLESMAGAMGRARGRTFAAVSMGAIPAAAMSAVARHGAAGSVERAREKMAEFGKCMSALDLSEGTDLDIEIARLGAAMGGLAQEMNADWGGRFTCDRSLAVPVMEQVVAAIGHLEAKLAGVEPQIARLEAERMGLLEAI